jgi:hypothetical protein
MASFLVEVDLVSVQIAHHYAGAVGLALWFTVELDAARFEDSVVSLAVVGFDAEQRQVGGLATDERPLFVRSSSIEIDRELVVVGQTYKEPSVVAHRAVFGHFEAELPGVELGCLILVVDQQLDQRDSLHRDPSLDCGTCGLRQPHADVLFALVVILCSLRCTASHGGHQLRGMRGLDVLSRGCTHASVICSSPIRRSRAPFV